MSEKRKLRFGVIGTGFWSTLQIPAWYEVGGVELVALYNRTKSKAEEFAKIYPTAKVYDEPEEMFEKGELDFVDIITEVPVHERFVLMAAKYKVPVICQKPMSETFESCLKMYNACKEAGIPYFIHENFRYQSFYTHFKSVLDENLIGRIRRAELFIFNGGKVVYSIQPFLRQLPHQILTDMGSHIFDLARYFFGEPQSVYANTIRTFPDIPADNYMAALLKYKDMICSVAMGERGMAPILVDGEDGSLQMGFDGNVTITTKDKTELRECPQPPLYKWAEHVKDYLPPRFLTAIVDCNRSFLKALLTGTKPQTDAEDNLKTAEIVFASCESVEKNKTIELKLGNK